MTKKILYIILSFVIISIVNVKAQSLILSPSAKISLLTHMPSDEAVYTLYGHTAIRIQDADNKVDAVFNYGIFDFDSPNFMYRFVKGETDYMVAVVPFNYYYREYKERGVSIIEQELNLNEAEKQNISNALLTNILPENRVYRYNYFYDNCSTRPRDIIEKNIQGSVKYTSNNKTQTYRDLIHECVSSHPWIQFGIDLVIGADADKLIDDKQKHFLPIHLMTSYDGAKVVESDSLHRNLLTKTNTLLESQKNVDTSSTTTNSPLIYGCLLLAVSLIISTFTIKGKYLVWGRLYDFLLFVIFGLVGSVIFFLMFFSEHPCTNPNWNITWLNPLELVFAFLFLIKYLAKYVYYYHFINFVLLTLFVLAWFLIPQHLELAFLPFILSIWIRSGANIILRKRKIM